ncbi:hypothetical protein [Burkholderia multivorans]|uniref:hypothetical protein n=1 Tax=Burkholderia multivorans TaxID=87883 RepID=UPI0020B1D469|nr:hypothetical protein [Burkholderia multivorans]
MNRTARDKSIAEYKQLNRYLSIGIGCLGIAVLLLSLRVLGVAPVTQDTRTPLG